MRRKPIRPIDFQNIIDVFGYDKPIENNYNPPINQFIESVNELGLDLSNDLTEEIINEAYLKFVIKYQIYLQDKVEPEFKVVGLTGFELGADALEAKNKL